MGTCGSCHGSGKVTCSACGGRGRVSRYGIGGVEINSCLVCGGRGRRRCDFCGGRGQISIPTAPVGQPQAGDPKQEVRRGFQSILETSRGSPVLAVLLASYCLGAKEQYHDLNLPTKKARRVMQADTDTFQAAVEDFVQALERGGWI